MSKLDKVYFGYIAYFIKNLGQQETKLFWKKFLNKKLGSLDFKEISSSKLRKTALILYYTHFLSLSLCISNETLLDSNKTPEELRDLFTDIEKLREKNNLPTLSIANFIDFKDASNHMEQFQESLKVLDDIASYGEKAPKKETTKKTTKTKKTTTTKPTTKKTTTTKPTTKKTTTTKPTTTKKTTNVTPDLYKMTVAQLKVQPNYKYINGKASMNKLELCKALTKLAAVEKKKPAKPKSITGKKAEAAKKTKKTKAGDVSKNEGYKCEKCNQQWKGHKNTIHTVEKGIEVKYKVCESCLFPKEEVSKNEKKKSTEKSEKNPPAENGEPMRLSVYSDKSIVVTGDTKTYKEKLKELGGRFNTKLSVGPGWIFQTDKKSALVKAFGRNIMMEEFIF